MRTATLFLAVVVVFAGLWGVTHADDFGLTSSVPASSLSSVSAPDTHIVDAPTTEATTTGATVLGVVTCVLGLLCGFALATLLFYALRLRLTRLPQLRQRPTPIVFSSAFNHHGRHRLSLFDLSLLRI